MTLAYSCLNLPLNLLLNLPLKFPPIWIGVSTLEFILSWNYNYLTWRFVLYIIIVFNYNQVRISCLFWLWQYATEVIVDELRKNDVNIDATTLSHHINDILNRHEELYREVGPKLGPKKLPNVFTEMNVIILLVIGISGLIPYYSECQQSMPINTLLFYYLMTNLLVNGIACCYLN